ncbi:MAG: 50S ribosomal protein L3 [Thermodesulfobacteriaceae bacterium]|nr:50S ribosomal protein L3 [Thermodesulfobacteriaceae bacterium]MCX8040965.1 50S ribosomal protein L3 [Thermodesulfobacteriaceae bacterium]MDW8135586.1 50S ribosomal protein L3 [Thermodesulfobacterium sp.]
MKLEGLIGKKIGMTRVFDENGNALPVTVLEVGPCAVVQVKTVEKDGYNAVQLGFNPKKLIRCSFPEIGHFLKAGLDTGFYILKEFKIQDPSEFKPGQFITLKDFPLERGMKVDVTGTSKGRGFTGTIKRWNFQRQPMSHGAKQVHRKRGSSGANTFPGRVIKGKKMAGHYGNETVTVKNLTVVDIMPEKNLLLVKGAVPGWNNGYVMIYFK